MKVVGRCPRRAKRLTLTNRHFRSQEVIHAIELEAWSACRSYEGPAARIKVAKRSYSLIGSMGQGMGCQTTAFTKR